jgi:hypothetical protein
MNTQTFQRADASPKGADKNHVQIEYFCNSDGTTRPPGCLHIDAPQKTFQELGDGIGIEHLRATIHAGGVRTTLCLSSGAFSSEGIGEKGSRFSTQA